MKKEISPALAEAYKKLRKQYGDDAIMTADGTAAKVEAIQTGCYAIDRLLGCNGIPRGRMIEVFGQESSGKSTFCLFLIAQVQKQGGKCLFIDAENAFDGSYAKNIGVDIEKLDVSQPSTLEEAMDIVRLMAETNEFDLIVIDSVAALVPKAELEGEEMLKDTMALQARLLGKALRIITGPVARSKTVVIFINQIREKVGVFYGNRETTPGGKALKFFSSVRLQVNKGDRIPTDKNEPQIGNTVNVVAVKNKVGFPWKKSSFDLYYGSGVDLVADTFDTANSLGDGKILDKTGNTYGFAGNKLGVGREAALKALRREEETVKRIKEDINRILFK